MNDPDARPSAHRALVYAADAGGGLVALPAEAVRPAVAAFGLLYERERVLLVVDSAYGFLHPPGGLVPTGREPGAALRRAFHAATGLVPRLGPLLFIDRGVRLLDGQPLDLSIFYYAVTRPRQRAHTFIDFAGPAQPRWIRLARLRREDMAFGYEAVRVLAAGRPATSPAGGRSGLTPASA